MHCRGLSNPYTGLLGWNLNSISFLSSITGRFIIASAFIPPMESSIISVINMVCSDSVPLFGYHRMSYLILSGLLDALSWSLMATFVDSKYSAAFCLLLGSFSVAFSDVVSVLF